MSVTVKPLNEYVNSLGGLSKVLRPDHPQYQAWNRWYWRVVQQDSGTVRKIDEFCIDFLGLLPQDVYGMEWFDL